MEKRIIDYLGVFKMGAEEHMNDLLLNGTIYMNSIQHFKKLEDDELRGDNYEGVSRIWNTKNGNFSIPSLGYNGKYQHLHLTQSFKEVAGNIYSMYCISSVGFGSPYEIKFDERLLNFGSHTFVVFDMQKFLDRMKRILDLTGLEFEYGLVNYYDKREVNKELTVFDKPDYFEYQKEYRFYLKRDAMDAFSFKLGSLEDIAKVIPTEAIFEKDFLTFT